LIIVQSKGELITAGLWGCSPQDIHTVIHRNCGQGIMDVWAFVANLFGMVL